MAAQTGGAVKLRMPPSFENATPDSDFTVPDDSFFNATWHVTHSSLPMWKDSRNVQITYKKLADGTVDDEVAHQALNKTKVKKINGIDTPVTDVLGAYRWRGKGWLYAITSPWAIIGHGTTPAGLQWALTYFEKTMFSAAGIDVYCEKPEGVGDDFIEEIRKAVIALGNPALEQLGKDLFEVKRDDGK
jgi:hypothetical protein